MQVTREARQCDALLIHQLSAQLGYGDTGAELAEERLAQLLASPLDYVWVTEREGKLVGWLHAFIAHRLASDSFVEIGGLIVDSQARRAGLGGELVQQARDKAKELHMALRVRCNDKRTESHTFYRDIGFAELKSQRVFAR